MALTDAQIEERFRHHPPTPEAARRHAAVTELLIETAKRVRDLVPESPGLAEAIRHLENARMWANQGIACNHALLPPEPAPPFERAGPPTPRKNPL